MSVVYPMYNAPPPHPLLGVVLQWTASMECWAEILYLVYTYSIQY